MGQWPTGIQPKSSGIELRLRIAGKRESVWLRWTPTPANITKAGKLREKAQQAIKWGQFSFKEFFPDSKQAQYELSQDTFSDYALRYMRGLTIAESTKRKYQQYIDHYYLPELRDRPLESIRFSELRDLLNDQPFRTNKTRNNVLTPLRGIFTLACQDGVINKNPTDDLKNGKHQYPDPDPLTLAEMDLMLDWLKNNRHESLYNYFEYSLFSGLRPSEQIALDWNHIDFSSGYAKIELSKMHGKIRSHTKTYKSRNVEFNERARQALTRQKKWTFLAGKEVFTNPVTGLPFADNKAIRNTWNAALKSCGIRHRVSYQARHTFCTNSLMAGANIHWVSGQMGHSSTTMTLNRYSKWVHQAHVSSETNKLDEYAKIKKGEKKVKNEKENG